MFKNVEFDMVYLCYKRYVSMKVDFRFSDKDYSDSASKDEMHVLLYQGIFYVNMKMKKRVSLQLEKEKEFVSF